MAEASDFGIVWGMRTLLAAGVLSGACYGAALTVPHWGKELTRFAPLYGLLILFYLLAVWSVGRVTRSPAFAGPVGGESGAGGGLAGGAPAAENPARLLAVIWIGAVLFRALALAAAAGLSDDLFRYLWDGKVLLHGVNPYRYPPSAEALAGLRDGLWSSINHPDLPTIYPPLCMPVFAAVRAISGTVPAWKLAMVCFDLAAGFVFLRGLRAAGRPATWVVLYLWHPLVVVEFAGSGHVDAVGLLLLALGFLFWARGRWFRSGLSLTLAGLVKFFPWVAVPLFARRLGRRWWLLPLPVALLYLVFAQGGVNPLGSLRTYAAIWRSNDFLFGLLVRDPHPTPEALRHAKEIVLVLVALLWVGLAAFRRPLPSAYGWTVGVLLLLSPVAHPWYVLWLFPAILFAGQPAWWIWSLTAFLAYAPLPGYLAGGVWTESGWLKAVEYLPVLVWIPVQIRMERRRRGAVR